jgi:hypothetical protein
MKRFLIVAGLLLATVSVHAQSADANASSNAQTSSGAAATNQGVTLTNTFQASRGVEYTGKYRVEAVAPLALGGAAAGFSNENCANTTQGGLSTFWFSASKGNATESVRCNARRDAGVYTALAADAEEHGMATQGANLRAMAWFQKCTATEQEMRACKKLGLITAENEPRVVSPEPVRIIPSRPANWTNASWVQKNTPPQVP